MSVSNSPANRTTRYRNVLSEAARDDEFSLESLKLCLREEHPSWEARLAREQLGVGTTFYDARDSAVFRAFPGRNAVHPLRL